jgi:hypothetical protein
MHYEIIPWRGVDLHVKNRELTGDGLTSREVDDKQLLVIAVFSYF